MTAPIALQLYSVREAMAQDFAGVVRQVAAMGYVGVEPIYKLPGTTNEAAAALFRELGLAVPSAHVPLPLGEDEAGVVEFMEMFGSTRIISGKGPADFDTLEKAKQTCELFNQASAAAQRHGYTFGIHNHWWEYLQVEGRYIYEVMLEQLDPAVFFEIDTYWVKAAGVDPVEVVRKMGSRAPILHIKDGPAVKSEPMTAVGDGILDFHSIISAGAGITEWQIVELDRCATDMMEAVKKSYDYLVGQGLARGKR